MCSWPNSMLPDAQPCLLPWPQLAVWRWPDSVAQPLLVARQPKGPGRPEAQPEAQAKLEPGRARRPLLHRAEAMFRRLLSDALWLEESNPLARPLESPTASQPSKRPCRQQSPGLRGWRGTRCAAIAGGRMKRDGFTLIELVMVLTVVFILAAVGAWRISGMREEARAVAQSDALATVHRMQALADMEGLPVAANDTLGRILELQNKL